MEITKTQNGTELELALEGRLDTVTSPELEAELDKLEGVEKIVINTAKLEYISSAGLRVLLSTQKRMDRKGGSMTIRNVNEEIKEIFEVTGFDEILTLEA
ncbi:MAG: STAS domain-containing protein [Fretibacterium sp.]|nr:STAS domain-containing protein [Fretibacterium sp.]